MSVAEIEPLLLSPNTASAVAGISATRLREAIRLGRLKAIMVGSHVRIKRPDLLAYIDGLPKYVKAARSPSTRSRKPARSSGRTCRRLARGRVPINSDL
jgi:excisionase family DNA binding protein